jgi:hypothetical protein
MCDDILAPKELVPVPPADPPGMLRQQSEPVSPKTRALQGKLILETADEDFPLFDLEEYNGISEPPADIRTLRQQSEPCQPDSSRIKAALGGKHFVETVDEDFPSTDLQEYNGTCSPMTLVPVAPSAPRPLDRTISMRRQFTC